ncbi:MAG: EscU/YscU/HrcU family type III secretion system export apparatus switch protein [bacterium]|nr:EscU/YscU/HrcU family type III secretion system export apparatus switch protein [bacterium]
MSEKLFPPSAQKLKKLKEQGDRPSVEPLLVCMSPILLILAGLLLYVVDPLAAVNQLEPVSSPEELIVSTYHHIFRLLAVALAPCVLFPVLLRLLLMGGLGKVNLKVDLGSLLNCSKWMQECWMPLEGKTAPPAFIYALKSAINFAVLPITVMVVICMAFLFLRSGMPSDPDGLAKAVIITLSCALVFVFFVSLSLGLTGYYFERKRWYGRHRMSVEELRREYRETEGNSEIKFIRRQLQHEMKERDLEDKVRSSTFIVSS